jgi:hypothetical protein
MNSKVTKKYKLFIVLIKDTTYMTSITINQLMAMMGLSVKEISSSQPVDVQENKI